MKILATLFFTIQLFFAIGIHSFTVPKIEGGNQALSAYQGKKILVVTLPVVQNAAADSILYSLDTLGAARTNTLKIIAVPAYEDGFTAAQKTQLKNWYRSKLRIHILITDGLYTRKTSGTQQHALFKWLTNATQNEVFDIDASSPGYKFFVNNSGALYSVMHPHTKISGLTVQRTLQMP
jgi:glutathione peroxidase-family protein